ncbi:PTS system, cellobiose-specific IIC component [Clostridium cavendishii DSM 21758]|uniref:Permease IIC component n=1 Tax=Clostridium cavendishii DSM 21758 TaxID=1121302 RepID=A0A1M6U8F8_9CLOT|nr:PTS transporter subunit EIIC [Clostridium cavendishii]SHK65469.1 PTS system, cellobiose-specific IIC component [Clostridium cavendishii DSM 21758]
MQKFMDWMERNIVPIAAKIGAQRHMVAMRDGFASIMPLMVVGGFGSLIHSWPFKGMKDALLVEGKPLHFLDIMGLNIYGGTLYIMAILATVAISYALAKSYESDGLAAGILSLANMFVLMCMFQFKGPTTWGENYYGWFAWEPGIASKWLGGDGLLMGVAVALISTTLFCKLERSGKLNISLPEGVPPAVARSFSALLPSAVILIITSAIVAICDAAGVKDIYWGIYLTVCKPLMGLAGSLPFALLLIFVSQVLWFFGLHGSNIVLPVTNAILLPLATANAAAVAAGQQPEHIVSSLFLDSYVNQGGSGLSVALLLVILIVSKSQLNKAVGKVSVGPGFFNINEPVIFGLPIVLNPIYIIPFILAPMSACIIAYVLTSIGFVGKTYVITAWTTPPIINAFLATGQWQGAATAAICIIVGMLIYFPFVMFADRRELQLEKQAESGSSVNM